MCMCVYAVDYMHTYCIHGTYVRDYVTTVHVGVCGIGVYVCMYIRTLARKCFVYCIYCTYVRISMNLL